MLHVIREDPNESSQLKRCLSYTQPDDRILFVADGVTLCLNWEEWKAQLKEKKVVCYCLKESLMTRGLLLRAESCEEMLQVSYRGWVELTEQHPRSIHW